eukprot:6374681-Amphidinium_carterae.1
MTQDTKRKQNDRLYAQSHRKSATVLVGIVPALTCGRARVKKRRPLLQWTVRIKLLPLISERSGGPCRSSI